MGCTPRPRAGGGRALGLGLGLGLGLLAACQPASPMPPPSQAKRPLAAVTATASTGGRRSVVLVTVDTLRADALSSYGTRRALTPHLERLAQGGVLFRQAFTQSTTTLPAHASLMTGLYLQDHNVYSNFEALGDASTTLAEVLRDQGVATYGLVNMRHLNPEVANLQQGFTDFVPSGRQRRADASVARLLPWLDAHRAGSSFAWLHLADAHTPYQPPPPFDRVHYGDDEHDADRNSLARIWPLMPTHMAEHASFQAWLSGITDVNWVLGQYRGAVSYVDQAIGQLLDGLDERDLLGDTAVILTADHGESLGEHGMYFVHTGLYESTVHVPLLAYFPGHTRQGTEVYDLVELVDLMPTILEYMQAPIPSPMRGQSLWPLMRGEVQPQRMAWIEHAGRNQVALRSHQYKYIRHQRSAKLQPAYPFVAGREELYDLFNDPTEQDDLAPRQPAALQTLRRASLARQASRLDLERGDAALNAETLEVLRSLGYVQR